MQQTQLFIEERAVDVPGLQYMPDYITPEEELALLHHIDASPWLTSLKRRVQHYGYRYDYKNRMVDPSLYLGPLPDWLQKLALRLLHDHIIEKPDQVIINEYLPGQGIAPHTDCIPCFGPVICSLSIGSACIMELKREQKTEILLEPRSLLGISGDARYRWQHGIPGRKYDHGVARGRRVSLTFRNVLR